MKSARQCPFLFRLWKPPSLAAFFILIAQPCAQGRDEDLLFLDNGMVKIGVNRANGGAITWLSWVGDPGNSVTHHDPGRLIQQSYHTGKRLDRRAP